MGFYVLQQGWYIQNNLMAALFDMLATSRSCGNICTVLNKATSHVRKIYKIESLLLNIWLLYLLDNVTCAVFLALIAV